MAFPTVPFVFSPNTIIRSAQVNADFQAITDAGNNIDASQITTGTLSIAQGGTGASTAAAAAVSLNVLPLTGGSLTGPLSVNGNIDTTGNISAQGSIGANGDIVTNSNLHAAGIYTGNITATGDISAGTVTASHLHSTGAIDADGAIGGNSITSVGPVYGAFLSSSGAVNAGTNLTVGGNGSISGVLGVTGDITTNSSLHVGGDISCGDINSVGVLAAQYLRGGSDGNAGTLLTYGSTNHVTFRWNGASLLFRIDGVLEHAIATTSLFEAMQEKIDTLMARVEALEATANAAA